MAQIPPGYAQANHRMLLTGDPDEMIVTMGIKFTTILFEDLDDIANALYDAWADAWEPSTVATWSFQGVTLYANIGGENFVVSSTTAVRVGDLSAGSLPQNNAYLVQKRTALGGRSNRGRLYQPGVFQDVVDDSGLLTGAFQASQQTAINSWLTAIQGITGVEDAVVLHSEGDIDPPTVITSLRLDSRIATQRRRLR